MGEYKILPCPFCGGRGQLEKSYRSFINGKSERLTLVRCLKCGARASRVRLRDFGASSHCVAAEQKAVEIWNKRIVTQN